MRSVRAADLRLLPAAVAAWTTAWAAGMLPVAAVLDGGLSWCAAGWVLLGAACVLLRRGLGGRLVGAVLVGGAGAALALTSVVAAAPGDHPASLREAQEDRALTPVTVRVDTGARPLATGGVWFDATALRVGDASTAAPVRVLLADPGGRLPVGAELDLEARAAAQEAPVGEATMLRAASVQDRRGPGGAAAVAEVLRSRFLERAALVGGDVAGLLPGLATGDTSALDAGLEEAMRTASLTHLTAVSGANCAVVVVAGWTIAALLGAGRRLRTVAALALLAGFVVLVTPEPSVVRAAVMATVVLLARLGRRSGAAVPALLATVVLLVAADPSIAGEARLRAVRPRHRRTPAARRADRGRSRSGAAPASRPAARGADRGAARLPARAAARGPVGAGVRSARQPARRARGTRRDRARAHRLPARSLVARSRRRGDPSRRRSRLVDRLDRPRRRLVARSEDRLVARRGRSARAHRADPARPRARHAVAAARAGAPDRRRRAGVRDRGRRRHHRRHAAPPRRLGSRGLACRDVRRRAGRRGPPPRRRGRAARRHGARARTARGLPPPDGSGPDPAAGAHSLRPRPRRRAPRRPRTDRCRARRARRGPRGRARPGGAHRRRGRRAGGGPRRQRRARLAALAGRVAGAAERAAGQRGERDPPGRHRRGRPRRPALRRTPGRPRRAGAGARLPTAGRPGRRRQGRAPRLRRPVARPLRRARRERRADLRRGGERLRSSESVAPRSAGRARGRGAEVGCRGYGRARVPQRRDRGLGERRDGSRGGLGAP